VVSHGPNLSLARSATGRCVITSRRHLGRRPCDSYSICRMHASGSDSKTMWNLTTFYRLTFAVIYRLDRHESLDISHDIPDLYLQIVLSTCSSFCVAAE